MKLVQSAGRELDGELPPAESCALNDGEEEEVQFSRPPTAGLLNRIIAMRAKVGNMQYSHAVPPADPMIPRRLHSLKPNSGRSIALLLQALLVI